MGGIGSTRWRGHERRRTVRAAIPLHVADLAGALHAARAWWLDAGRPDAPDGAGWIGAAATLPPDYAWRLLAVAPAGDRWRLGCQGRQRGTRNGRVGFRPVGPIRAEVVAEAVPAPLGGVRWWLRCPGCDRRQATLYAWYVGAGPGAGVAYECRRCSGFCYPSQQMATEERLAYRVRRLAARLGDPWPGAHDPDDPPPPRPPRMHRATYTRVVAQYVEARVALEEHRAVVFARGAARLLARLGVPRRSWASTG